MAHDLKGSLNGIASLVDFVVEDYADRLDDDGQERLRMIQRMAHRGVAMVDALRQFARVSTVSLNPRTLDLALLATRALDGARKKVPGVAVEAGIAPALPAVSADLALVSVLLDRLFVNALQFGDRTTRSVRFGTGAADAGRVPDGHVAFTVQDDGIGVAERHRETIFDMFTRLHAADTYGGGVGAGLAVARAIVQRHQGTIWAEPVAGRGSAFIFTLPAAPAAGAEAAR